ncbi:MAG: efflux RND transporter periplasmic adaptor subunit [Phycisphaerae bacterium]|nr:efflux RND transporter periplasmic adaptor subunit [Phycisphaerae bacterium]
MTPLHAGLIGVGRWGCAALVALLASPPSAPAPGSPRPEAAVTDSARTLVGFANPSRRVAFAATTRGRIGHISVEEGALVKADAPLLELDAELQRRRTEIARADAESKLEIELAKVRLDAALAEKTRIEALAEDRGASAKELSDAQALASAAAVEHKQAEFAQQQQERDFALQQEILDQHALRAPFDGYVVQVLKQAGDVVNELEPVIILAQLDPLEVIIECPVEVARGFSSGQTISVAPPSAAWPVRAGRIASINAVANAASQTVRLRILVPNADLAWPAGLKVTLQDPPPPAAAAAGRRNALAATNPQGVSDD